MPLLPFVNTSKSKLSMLRDKPMQSTTIRSRNTEIHVSTFQAVQYTEIQKTNTSVGE